MEDPVDLQILGGRLKKVDTLFLDIAKRRMQLALQVEVTKTSLQSKDPEKSHIIHVGREKERIEGMRARANEIGLDPNFGATLESLLILQSCHDQLGQREDRQKDDAKKTTPDPMTEDGEYEQQKKNLISLTEHWSLKYDQEYENGHFGTKAYRAFEREIMEAQIKTLPHHGNMVDLGCATGTMTLPLSKHFEFSSGYDISQHMVERAYMNSKNYEGQNLDAIKKVNFEQVDLETGIPMRKDSVSYVIMNLGTASDLKDVETVIKRILYVLKPGGKFFLSFYNKDALMYQWEFIPWLVGLTASINLYKNKNCLEVYDPETKKEVPIFARPYTSTEVRDLLKDAGDVQILTYPAMSMILPSVLFEGSSAIQNSIVEIDRTLINTTMGAYIIATGCKPA